MAGILGLFVVAWTMQYLLDDTPSVVYTAPDQPHQSSTRSYDASNRPRSQQEEIAFIDATAVSRYDSGHDSGLDFEMDPATEYLVSPDIEFL